jgi:hypothetical protein
VLQSVPCHWKKSVFVLIPDNNITRAITTEKAKGERDQNRKENFTNYIKKYLDPKQGEWNLDPSSALAT